MIPYHSCMSTLLDRFCRYVRVDTTADEKSTTVPTTPGQLELGRMLRDELRAVGLKDADQDEHGIVLATVPATVPHTAPVVAWIAHVDTSPETTGSSAVRRRSATHAVWSGSESAATRGGSGSASAATGRSGSACSRRDHGSRPSSRPRSSST